jgi:hypothetical protein
LVWNYDAEKKLYSSKSGSTVKLSNGNMLIGYGISASRPALTELHPDSSIAYSMNFQNGISSYKAFKFPWRTNLFTPNRYSITYPEWDGYTYADYILTLQNISDQTISITSCYNKKGAFKIVSTLPINITAKGKVQIVVRYEPGYNETGVIEDILTINSDINSDTLIQRVSQQVKLFGSKPDITPPIAVIPIANNMNVPADTIFYVSFSEAIRKPDNSEFNYLNIDSLIIFKTDNPSGAYVSFDAVFSSDKKLVSISSNKELLPGQNYFLSVSGDFEDYYGNKGSEVSGIFKTESISSVYTHTERKIKIYPNP